MMILQKIQLKVIYFYHFIIIKTWHQFSIIRKKSHEHPDDFYSNVDNDGDDKTYQEKLWELTDKQKVN